MRGENEFAGRDEQETLYKISCVLGVLSMLDFRHCALSDEDHYGIHLLLESLRRAARLHLPGEAGNELNGGESNEVGC